MDTITEFQHNMDIKYAHQEIIDIAEVVEMSIGKKQFSQSLTEVNDSVVRVGIIEGIFPLHKHQEEDEFFFVLEGTLVMEIEGKGEITVLPHQGITVPKGVMHRPIAKERIVILLVEKSTIVPNGE